LENGCQDGFDEFFDLYTVPENGYTPSRREYFMRPTPGYRFRNFDGFSIKEMKTMTYRCHGRHVFSFLPLILFSGIVATALAQNGGIPGNPNPAGTYPQTQYQSPNPQPVTQYAQPQQIPQQQWPNRTQPPVNSGPPLVPAQPLGATPASMSAQQTPPSPAAPFTLTPQEQAYLNQFLAVWQQKSNEIQSLDCEFVCRVYNGAFSADGTVTNATYGRAKYIAPDKGMIATDGEYVVNAQGVVTTVKNEKSELRSKFICDGKSVFHFDYADKKLLEFPIPPEQRGQGLLDSPLMTVVGANPEKLQNRFYLRLVQPPENLKDCYVIEAWPKWMDDAKEFQYVQVVLDRSTFKPKGLVRSETDGQSRASYYITNVKPNIIDRWFGEKDEFARNNILKSKPGDMTYELRNDPVPTTVRSQVPNANLVHRIPQPVPAQPQPNYAQPAPNNMPPYTPGMTPNPTPNVAAPNIQPQPGAYSPPNDSRAQSNQYAPQTRLPVNTPPVNTSMVPPQTSTSPNSNANAPAYPWR
ncbi:MAG: hypothetical protein FWC50_10545, partial [Planctomycetaceae bacterium]|nr:hypothetical protein [Planctomycetaceae bacterium]